LRLAAPREMTGAERSELEFVPNMDNGDERHYIV
jgi:hypothetical protein